jgi:stage II sporulation protein D
MTRGMVLGYDGLLVSGYYSSCCGGVAASAKDAIGSNPVNDVDVLEGRPQPDICNSAPVYQWKVEYPIEVVTRRLVAFGKEKRIKDLSNFTRLEGIDVAARNVHGRPTRIRVIDQQAAGGVAVELRAEEFRRAVNYAGQGLSPPDKLLRSSHVKAIFNRDTVEFEGYGFGHGVGLCQYGAEILAKDGKQFHEILLWYYPGVELVPAYG